MIENNPQKGVKYICGRCGTIFSPYGGKSPIKCMKCGHTEFEEMVKTKTEVVQK
jgi:DNA-directed RNA polymerase subunit RPC12/RpoP